MYVYIYETRLGKGAETPKEINTHKNWEWPRVSRCGAGVTVFLNANSFTTIWLFQGMYMH